MRRHIFESVAIVSAAIALSLNLSTIPVQAVSFKENVEVNVTDNNLLANASNGLSSTNEAKVIGGDLKSVGDLGMGVLLCLGLVSVFALLEERSLRRSRAVQQEIVSSQPVEPNSQNWR